MAILATDIFTAPSGISGYSGYSGTSGSSGYSAYSGVSGYSGYSGPSGFSAIAGGSGASGTSGYSGASTSGYSGYSGSDGDSGYSGYSGDSTSGYSGYSGGSTSGYSGYSGDTGSAGDSGYSGYSGEGTSGYSGYSGESTSGYSGYSGDSTSGYSGYSGDSTSGYSGYSSYSGPSGASGFSGGGGGGSTKALYVLPSGFSCQGYPQTSANESGGSQLMLPVSGCSFAVASGHCYEINGWMIFGIASSGTSEKQATGAELYWQGPSGMSNIRQIQGTRTAGASWDNPENNVTQVADVSTGAYWTVPRLIIPCAEVLDSLSGTPRGATTGVPIMGLVKPLQDGWCKPMFAGGGYYDENYWNVPWYSGVSGFLGRSWFTVEDLGEEVDRS